MTDQQHKAYITALLNERAGYERMGQTERVKAVDAELARVGHKAAAPAQRATKRDRA